VDSSQTHEKAFEGEFDPTLDIERVTLFFLAPPADAYTKHTPNIPRQWSVYYNLRTGAGGGLVRVQSGTYDTVLNLYQSVTFPGRVRECTVTVLGGLTAQVTIIAHGDERLHV
jgi:hypothetical protein